MSHHRAKLAAASIGVAGLTLLSSVCGQPATERSADLATTNVVATQPRIIPAPAFGAQIIASNLTAPWAIAFLPDGRALVTERSGKVRLVRDGVMLDAPALVVPNLKVWVKMGLLGVAVDPHFARNGFVYLAECYGDANIERDSWLRVVRYTMRDDQLFEPTTLIDAIPAYLNHAGGRLAFGPDGKLYITTGDSDRPPLAQDRQSLAGKILRINTDGTIPDDNPFAHASDANGAIWSYGHRNAQGLAFQPGTGALFASEHGPNGGDEINRIVAGANYGWPTVSHERRADGMTPSLAEFTPSVGPADATFYDGAMFPELQGDLLVACLRGETILRVRLDDAGERVVHVERLLHEKFGRLREVTVAPDGALWITTSEVDPPEGRNREGYDQLIRLTRGTGLADASAVPDANTTPRPVGAVAIYAVHCASCHGSGSGPSLNSSLFDRTWTLGVRNDDDMRRIIADGVVERGMPAYRALLTTREINEVIGLIHVREGEPR